MVEVVGAEERGRAASTTLFIASGPVRRDLASLAVQSCTCAVCTVDSKTRRRISSASARVASTGYLVHLHVRNMVLLRTIFAGPRYNASCSHMDANLRENQCKEVPLGRFSEVSRSVVFRARRVSELT